VKLNSPIVFQRFENIQAPLAKNADFTPEITLSHHEKPFDFLFQRGMQTRDRLQN
jgi:hypothetical protein